MRQNGNSVKIQSRRGSLVTSNEELWSRNEELTGLNIQLKKTLERQHAISSHLRNLLYSADVAAVFLDSDLNIRFFTPAAKSLFSIISRDLGRPLADLESLADDGALLADARAVLQKQISLERVVEAQSGLWFIRQILLYRTNDDRTGVFWSPNYIQHSAHIPPGHEGLLTLIKSSPGSLHYESGLSCIDRNDVFVLHRTPQ